MLNNIDIDVLFRAASDPTRRDMIEALAGDAMTVSRLAGRYDMTLSAVSQHLKVLIDAGLVNCEKVGRVRTCRLEMSAITTLEGWVMDRRMALERRLDRLEHYLALEDKAPQ